MYDFWIFFSHHDYIDYIDEYHKFFQNFLFLIAEVLYLHIWTSTLLF
jgi:hypothetical protein